MTWFLTWLNCNSVWAGLLNKITQTSIDSINTSDQSYPQELSWNKLVGIEYPGAKVMGTALKMASGIPLRCVISASQQGHVKNGIEMRL